MLILHYVKKKKKSKDIFDPIYNCSRRKIFIYGYVEYMEHLIYGLLIIGKMYDISFLKLSLISFCMVLVTQMKRVQLKRNTS